jgi:hypothetical protein
MGDHKFNPHARGNVLGQLPLRVRDAYGRILTIGDEVILSKPVMTHFRIQDVAPILDPGMPPNHVRVMLGALLVLAVPADGAIGEVIRVRTADEQGITPAAQAGEAGTSEGSPSEEPPPATLEAAKALR